MARAKKTEKFVKLYSGLSMDDKKILRTELDYAIKAEERDILKMAQEEAARKMRDTLKIHDKIKFTYKKETKEGEVITISVDKVQVLVNGKDRMTVPYQKILK
ncbi:hypothetical protein EXM22_15475 [Oceanispirochaeta crateris]|uniref:Uncharacterized protein n=1 Tax=Oceanispirochaeta crateris TaxID=2518645 RepID=A0A5C1QQS1_9SPIO|nr:hypothetical protein [Oceanispirochaeta crateris]QEN09310.1 hypothetical protein EXM22_15475 [Oceanispirochaeta crateris]